MYPVTLEALELLRKNYRQTVEIIAYGLDDTFTLTEKDVLAGGLTIDRTSVSSSKIEIGSAISSELSLKLQNEDGRFDNVKFEGAELYVRLGVKKYDAHRWEKATTQYIPLGYFTVDEPVRPLSALSIKALDRMVLFDKPVNWSLFSHPITVKNMLAQTCQICNVQLGNNINDRPNCDYVIQALPETEITYRQIIQWIAELTATCAFIDWEGKLRLQWYEPTATKITPSTRYSSDMLENDITITGVQVVDVDSNVYISGSDDYAFNLEGNELIQSDYQQVADNLYSAVGGFTYRPYNCSTIPMPYLFPMDRLEYVDKNQVSHDTIVTNVTFTMNAGTTVEGKGETAVNNGYASANLLTNRERIIMNKIKREQNQTLKDRVQSVLGLNELITNSLGLYNTSFENNDGSITYYMHDRPNLEDSNTIYTLNAGGYAYTNNGWNDGNPVWLYGETKDGNAVFNAISTYKIQTEDLEAESIRVKWNSISDFVEISHDGLSFYDSADKNSDDLVARMNKSGAHFCNAGKDVGNIGISYYGSDFGESLLPGLYFGLNSSGGFMGWGHEMENTDSGMYAIDLLYLKNEQTETDSPYNRKGLHFGCDVYTNGHLYLIDDYRLIPCYDGDGENQIRYDGNIVLYGRSVTFGNSYIYSDHVMLGDPDGGSSVSCYADVNIYGDHTIIQSSDARLKKNIRQTKVNGLNTINSLDLKEFDWVENDSHEEIGIIAQQLQKVAPELVTEDSDGYLSIKTTKFIFYLIKAVQELSKKIGLEYEKTKWSDTYTLKEKKKLCTDSRKDGIKKSTQEIKYEPMTIPIQKEANNE